MCNQVGFARRVIHVSPDYVTPRVQLEDLIVLKERVESGKLHPVVDRTYPLSAEPHVSVRAVILSLVRFGIAPKEQTNTLDRDWTKYRKMNGLDLYGKEPKIESVHVSGCVHHHF